MKNFFLTAFCLVVTLSLSVTVSAQTSFPSQPTQTVPGVTDGTGLVPCNGPTGGSDECNFNALLRLAQNVINFLMYISVFIAAIAFFIAGFKYITASGNESQIKSATHIFTNVVVGLAIALSAWLLVNTVLTTLLGTNSGNYSLLKSG